VSAATALVDLALDRYVAAMRRRGDEPYGVRAQTLAALVKVPRVQMSASLQEHRLAQEHAGRTRYVLAAERYGRSSYWIILAKPGDDPKLVQEARKAHAVWMVRDGVQRVMSDAVREVSS
jgi:hypothetical protein